jgi:hypothetical protein
MLREILAARYAPKAMCIGVGRALRKSLSDFMAATIARAPRSLDFAVLIGSLRRPPPDRLSAQSRLCKNAGGAHGPPALL